ncbi:MAG: hypothetical protein JWP89_1218 [Schlesneria sp.]|nr:hypothetical protein [Schlesneria sp.]
MTAPAPVDPSLPTAPAPRKSGVLSFIKYALLLLIIGVAGFLGFVATLPDDFTVARSITIDASPEQLFPWINNLKKTHQWSPWTKLDPNAKYTFEGPEEGTGASHAWVGNDKMGEGKMTITDSQPNKEVTSKLEFKKPMEDTSTVKLALLPEGEKTKVTWSMSGHYGNLFQKAICCLMNMDKMVGGNFEEGLNNLKTTVAADKEHVKEEMKEETKEEVK